MGKFSVKFRTFTENHYWVFFFSLIQCQYWAYLSFLWFRKAPIRRINSLPVSRLNHCHVSYLSLHYFLIVTSLFPQLQLQGFSPSLKGHESDCGRRYGIFSQQPSTKNSSEEEDKENHPEVGGDVCVRLNQWLGSYVGGHLHTGQRIKLLKSGSSRMNC